MSNAELNQYYMGPKGEHDHIWGTKVERAPWTGNPHHKCQVEGCKFITDLDEEDDDE